MGFYEILQSEIEAQYGSIYSFSQVAKVSQSTFTRINQLGIGSCSKKTVRKIALNLGLDYEALLDSRIEGKTYSPEEIARFNSEKIASATDVPLNPIEEDILAQLRGLDVSGQFKVLEYIKDITPKYERKD